LENVVKGALAPKGDVPILQAIQPPPQPVFPPPPVFNPPPQAIAPQQVVQTLPPVDPNQLEFDLNKVTKYEDIINAIDRLHEKMNRLEDKLDTIIKNSQSPKKKATGLVES
jgi:hypothetical protein